jgi:long-chain acyl-CoA synthetase
MDLSDIISVKKYPIPSPTILFVKPDHLRELTESILAHAKKNRVLNIFAWRHKLAALTEGFVCRESLWDRLVFDGARAETMGDMAGTLRAVVVGGGK